MSLDPKTVKEGDKVWWDDPADGLSSGVYTVVEVFTDCDAPADGETIVALRNEAGSEAEVLMQELRAPEGGRRTTWADTRAWDAAMAASALARGADNHEELPFHHTFDPHLAHDNPIVSLICNLLTLAHFDGANVEEVLAEAHHRFKGNMAEKGEFDTLGRIDEARTEWAHRILATWNLWDGGDKLELMGKLARLGD